MGTPEWYRQPIDEVVAAQKVAVENGLSADEAVSRLKLIGSNQLAVGKKINPLKLFISQFNDVLIMVLIAAAAVSFALTLYERSRIDESVVTEPVVIEVEGVLVECNDITARTIPACEQMILAEAEANFTESLLIFGIVFAIAVVGFLNEYKAEKTVEALRKLVGHKAKVRRDGAVLEIDAVDVVPGDIVILEEGMKVPADIRLHQVRELRVNEASLTGESVPVFKNTFTVERTVTIGDRKNMVFSGTIIASGTAEGIVVATGQSTEIGKIAGLVNNVEEELTPMQRKLDELGRKIGAIVLGISIFVFVVIFFLDKDLADISLLQRLILSFTAAVALAVAAIPEGLAFVVRISLALGARRMAAKNALVRKLSAVEALGSTDVICSDKTGTLTRGEMTVRKIWASGVVHDLSGTGYETEGEFTIDSKPSDLKLLQPLLRIGVLNNNAHLKDGAILGDPTEGALLVSGAKAALLQDKQNTMYPRVDEIPFSSDRKMMSTIHSFQRGFIVASKGAPDVMLHRCDRILKNGKVIKMTNSMKKEILAANSEFASQALRVLGFAYKVSKQKPQGKKIETGLIFLGLQGMMDPPRTEVKNVMHRVHAEAGMRVIMITGDYIDTAKAVAAEIGIEGEAISGTDLDNLTQEEFERRVEKISVYARVNPEHKIRIVQALKKHGHQVAMTGDGVNDAPAIKAADIGIAMGISGTDAAKEASDMILLDDQFITIIGAIEEGRGIFDNVRKFVNYLLSANIAEVLTVLGGVVMFGKLVLSAAQLLFINIVTDGLPAIALGSDQAERGIMRFKPHRFQEQIINRRVWYEMFIFGMLMTIALLGHYWWIGGHQHESGRAVAVAFTAMVIYEMVRLVDIRTDYKIRWFSNPWLTVAIAASLLLQVAVVYNPWLNDLFGIAPIHAVDWVIIGIVSVILFVSMKIVNMILDRALNEVSPQYSSEHYERV